MSDGEVGPGRGSGRPSDLLRPFQIRVTNRELDALRARLVNAARLPELPGRPGEYGGSAASVQALVDYWRDGYDWPAWEARLNEHRHYVTTIDGTAVHFLHVRSPEPDALPLLLTHGWPGTVAEFLDLIGPLSDPRRYDLDPVIAFDLVIPSLPGCGWSGPTPDAGWGPRRIAGAWGELMRRLGYRRYGAAGNDWGSKISPEVGRVAPDEVLGVHVTQLFSLPEGESMSYPPSVEPTELAELSPSDREALAVLRAIQRDVGAYSHLHTQQPDRLALALADSPIGLLAWNSQSMTGLDPDVLLTHVSIHWHTATAGSALRLYADEAREPSPPGPTTVPLGLAQFPNDIQAIRRYAERDHANIVSWNVYDRGSHYAAHQAPDLLIADLRTFFTSLR